MGGKAIKAILFIMLATAAAMASHDLPTVTTEAMDLADEDVTVTIGIEPYVIPYKQIIEAVPYPLPPYRLGAASLTVGPLTLSSAEDPLTKMLKAEGAWRTEMLKAWDMVADRTLMLYEKISWIISVLGGVVIGMIAMISYNISLSARVKALERTVAKLVEPEA